MTFLINIFFWLLSGLLEYQSSREQNTPLLLRLVTLFSNQNGENNFPETLRVMLKTIDLLQK